MEGLLSPSEQRTLARQLEGTEGGGRRDEGERRGAEEEDEGVGRSCAGTTVMR